MSGRKRLALGASILALLVGLAAFTLPLRDCVPCEGRRHPVWDMDPEWRKEFYEQIKVCQACWGKGRVPLVRLR